MTFPYVSTLVDNPTLFNHTNPLPVNVGALDILPNTAVPQTDAPYAPNLVITDQIAQLKHEHVLTAAAPIMYKFESEIATLRYKNGLTLQEARQETRRQGFSHTLVTSLTLPLHPKMSPLPLLHSTSLRPILLPL